MTDDNETEEHRLWRLAVSSLTRLATATTSLAQQMAERWPATGSLEIVTARDEYLAAIEESDAAWYAWVHRGES